MAQLKQDEWPAELEPTTTETEVPATSPLEHDQATDRAHETMKDRMDEQEPLDRTSDGPTG